MKKLSKITFIFLTITLLFPIKNFCQNTEHETVSNDQLIKAARDIIASTTTCALITMKDSIPMVRVMDPFPPENDFTVWFGTNPKSRKVNQIKKNPKVTLYYLDKDASGYVVIHGIAQLVNDQTEKEKRWKDTWKAFYPDKTESYLLIKVSPVWMEVISYKHGIVGDTNTWQPPIVEFDSMD
jgi:general stress protein 26